MKKGHSISTMQTMFEKCYDLTLVDFESFDIIQIPRHHINQLATWQLRVDASVSTTHSG